MSDSNNGGVPPSPKKVCFVTIGATASFASLIYAVLSTAFFAALEVYGYTDLLVQYGKDGEELYRRRLKEIRDTGLYSRITASGFGLDAAGLGKYMRLAKAGGEGGAEGVVVSHAGA